MGRSAQVHTEHNSISIVFNTDEYCFARNIKLEGTMLQAIYHVTNNSRVILPYIWIQHCLLAVNEDERIYMNGIDRAWINSASNRKENVPSQFTWPFICKCNLNLSRIHGPSASWSMKLNAPIIDQANCGVIGRDSMISMQWKSSSIPYAGIWLNNGGWPDASFNNINIAIEPTKSMEDCLPRKDKLKNSPLSRTWSNSYLGNGFPCYQTAILTSNACNILEFHYRWIVLCGFIVGDCKIFEP